MSKPIVFCITSLHHGNGGKYVATNLAYYLKSKTTKKNDVKIALIDANKKDASLAVNLEQKTLSDLTNQLKFDVVRYRLTEDSDFAVLKKEIFKSFDFVIISTELENLSLVDKFCKNKTNVLVIRPNRANNDKIESNIEMIKTNFKYALVNCSEKTVKISSKLKENNIKIVARILYNEWTIDNINILKATKLNHIKYINNFKSLSLLRNKKDI